MDKKELIIMADYSQKVSLTTDEVCEILNIPANFIHDLIEFEIISYQGTIEKDNAFDLAQLKRIKTALRLQRDLEMNLAGISVVFNLLDELETLRAKVELLEKHFLNL